VFGLGCHRFAGCYDSWVLPSSSQKKNRGQPHESGLSLPESTTLHRNLKKDTEGMPGPGRSSESNAETQAYGALEGSAILKFDGGLWYEG
jgi:hypothetical protein